MIKKKIAVSGPNGFYEAVCQEALERDATLEQTCAELFSEGVIAYNRLVEKYQPEYLIITMAARVKSYVGPHERRWTFDVKLELADEVHNLANDNNIVTPSMTTIILGAGLWGLEGSVV